MFRAAESACADLAKHERAAQRLIESWKEYGSSSGIALHIETRSKRIRWRATHKVFGHQRALDYSADEMSQIIANLSEEAHVLLLGFEHRRIMYNVKLSTTRHHIKELESYMVEARALEDSAPAQLKTQLIDQAPESRP